MFREALTETQIASLVTFPESLLPFLVKEQAENFVNITGIRVFGVFYRDRSRDDSHDLFAQGLVLGKQVDGVAVALAHLLPVKPGYRGDVIINLGQRQGKDIAILTFMHTGIA